MSRCPFALTFSREQPKFHCIVSCNFEQHKNTSCAREQRRIVLAIMNDSLHLHRHEEFISKSSALMLRCPVTVIYAVHRCRLVIWGECSGSEGSEGVWRAGDCVGKVGTCDDISGQPSGSSAQNLNHNSNTLTGHSSRHNPDINKILLSTVHCTGRLIVSSIYSTNVAACAFFGHIKILIMLVVMDLQMALI